MSAPRPPYHLFDVFGVEIEYMIVDRQSLSVRPIADEILRAATGSYSSDHEEGPIAWSNELVLHLIELKINDPAPTLAGFAALFDADVARINRILEDHSAMLLPGGMHPTMDPKVETRLWPHQYGEIYATYDRIFDCRRHGWANLQSVHLNLPFCGDAELGRLHAACRAVLPVLPAIAASSPVMDGRPTGRLDNRLHVYCTHQARIPEAMGEVIPEPVWTRRDYEERVLQPMYRAIRPHDPTGVLQHEFLNARGAIVRFERDAIEIRLMDVQECPRADLALALLVSSAVRAVVEERYQPIEAAKSLSTGRLVAMLRDCIDRADEAVIADEEYLRVFGVDGPVRALDLWRRLAGDLRREEDPAWAELGPALQVILDHGPLARRMLKAYGPSPDRRRIDEVSQALARCLADARPFLP